jgi:hypothetical protein
MLCWAKSYVLLVMLLVSSCSMTSLATRIDDWVEEQADR